MKPSRPNSTIESSNSRRNLGLWPKMLTVSCALLLGGTTNSAEEVRLVIQRTLLAGFTHHAAKTLWSEMREGDTLNLVAEPTNPYDAYAIRVDWHDQIIGYLPRTANGAIAQAKKPGNRVMARISALRNHPDPRRRIEVEVYVVLISPHQNADNP